jgi:hypothetical protein
MGLHWHFTLFGMQLYVSIFLLSADVIPEPAIITKTTNASFMY